jgi:PAS domain S-box-containing protein
MLDDKSPTNANDIPVGLAVADEFAEPPVENTAVETETADAAPVEPTPDYEAPALSGEAPAEFALDDEFIMPPEQPDAEATQAPEPVMEMHHDDDDEHLDNELLDEGYSPEEPSPYVEPVADEPALKAAPAPEMTQAHQESQAHHEPQEHHEDQQHPEEPGLMMHEQAWPDEPTPEPRTAPLRFLWQMDAESRFTLDPECSRLIGARTTATLGHSWRDVADRFDPDGCLLRAVATRNAWTGVDLNWPVDGGDHLPVELSGLLLLDRAGNYGGYRGFGICRDLDAMTRIDGLRHHEALSGPPPQALSAGIVTVGSPIGFTAAVPIDLSAGPTDELTDQSHDADSHADALSEAGEPAAPAASDTSAQGALQTETPESGDLENQMEPPRNVLPFRLIGDTKSLALTPVENYAFNELARQLAERLEREADEPLEPLAPLLAETPDVVVEPPAVVEVPAVAEAPEVSEPPGWLARAERPARGDSRRDRALFDLLPLGVLIYRLDRLVYANAAFLQRMGYDSLNALEEAGGLDALYVEPGVSSASSTSDTGTPVTISATQASTDHTPPAPTEARLYTISWDDESALALICSGSPAVAPVSVPPDVPVAAIPAAPVAIAEPVAPLPPSPVGHANAEELATILDTTAEGILMFDAEGNINSCNRSAEALFGHDGANLVQRNIADLFAPESAPAVRDYLERVKGEDISSLFEQGRDLLARVGDGGLIPVSMTIGRTRAEGPNFFAVFRDLSQNKKSESELREARRLADRAANGKADMLARISHEVRAPLNAILGFADVMIGERFGALGNERYVEYMKDIRASGERVIAIIDDLLDLTRIETGKLELAFTTQNLNDLVEQCVSVMQPNANRERIIIRTSLAHHLPSVLADSRALRQITLNLIGTSIRLANAGGQVIVSTALSDIGQVVLRVRDTGHGLNDNEVAAAMQPFRASAPSDQASESSALSLSLTKALVEANRAQFQIKTGGHSGTLIEVLFPHAMARA